MTSKISCTKLILEDIRHRGWTAALTCTVLFLMMPVYALLYLRSYSQSLSDPYVFENVSDSFPGLFTGYSMTIVSVALAAVAILCALTGFSYIHSRERLDFFHSLPITRTRWFSSTYLAGLIILIVPYLICAALTVGVGAAEGIMTAETASRSVQSALGGLLGIIVIYNASIFAVILTGRTVTGLLASLTVVVYPLVVLTVFSLLQSTYFDSFYAAGEPLANTLSRYLSPAGIFVTLARTGAHGDLSLSCLLAAIVMSAALAAVSLILYRVYPSEAAGNSIAFSVLAPIVKVLICIPTALFVGVMVPEIMAIPGTTVILPLSLAAAVLLCIIVEFVYHMDFKKLLINWRSSLISIAGVVIVICIFQFDLPGYDTYLPDEDKIESISFRPNAFDQYFSYPDEYLSDSDYTASPDVTLGIFAPKEAKDILYKLAQSGISNFKNGITTDSIYNDSESDAARDYTCTVFRYKLSGGHTVVRQYVISREEASQALEQLLEYEDYKRALFPIFHVDKSRVTGISLSDAYASPASLTMSAAQRQELLGAYEKDVLGMTSETLLNESPLAEFFLEMSDTADASSPDSAGTSSAYSDNWSQVSVSMFYIYPGYTNTLKLLEDYGYSIRTEINPADVSSVTLTLCADSIQSGKYSDMLSALSDTASISQYDIDGGTSITAYSEEDISLILNSVTPYQNKLLDDSIRSGDYMDIDYNNEPSGGISLE